MNLYNYFLKKREGYLLIALIGMILIEYMMFYSFLFSEYKLLSFTIMCFSGITGLKANEEFWKCRKVEQKGTGDTNGI